MLDVRIACPQCQKRLKTLEPLVPGQRFRCPRCGHSFAVGSSDIKPSPAERRPAVLVAQPYAPPPLTLRAEPAADVRSPSVTDIPPPTLLPVPEARAGTRAFLLIVAVAGVFLAGGVGLAVMLSPGQKKDEAVQKADADDKPADTPPQAETPLKPLKTEDAGKKPSPPPDGKRRPPSPGLDEPPPRPAPITRLSPETQAKVDKAIDKGVVFLKHQQRKGTWAPNRGHGVALAALPALTLLECGVPVKDPVVRKALAYVRQWSPAETKTYDLALAILLLDRVGEARDRRLLQTLALRLAAGQRSSGGWSYKCPPLNAAETENLFTALQQTRPKNAQQLFAVDRGDRKLEFFVPAEGSPEGISAEGTGRFQEATVVGPELKPGATAETRASIPLDRLPPRKVKIDKLPPNLRNLPVLKPLPRATDLPRGDGTDNSNTQFAILGVWAATRHGVPMERTLALLVKRFTRSQNVNGTWGYYYGTNGNMRGMPAMTCSGLLGLAVGHGMFAGAAPTRRTMDKDPAIKKALEALSQHLGKPSVNRFDINHYFLWSVERVGVLFNLPRIGGKDWYTWGAGALVGGQSDNGSWEGGTYHGSGPIPNTCFALLFLKRVNLTRDLTRKLDFLADTDGK